MKGIEKDAVEMEKNSFHFLAREKLKIMFFIHFFLFFVACVLPCLACHTTFLLICCFCGLNYSDSACDIP